ncbi:MAG: HEAT repeat domain-containing protein [Planctomycetota bacterium]
MRRPIAALPSALLAVALLAIPAPRPAGLASADEPTPAPNVPTEPPKDAPPPGDPAPVPPKEPAPADPKPPAAGDAPADPAAASQAAKKQRVAELRAGLPAEAKPALDLLDAFAKRDFRLWTTLRHEVVAQGEAATMALVVGLAELDWEVRAFTASCVAELKAKRCAEALRRAAAEEPFLEARRQMTLALAALDDAEARDLFAKAAASTDPGLRLAGVRGLAAVTTADGVDALLAFARDADLDVRYEAVGRLVALGHAPTVDAVVKQTMALVADAGLQRVDVFNVTDNGDRYEAYLLGGALARSTDPKVQKLALAALLGEKPWERKDSLRMGLADGLGRAVAAGAPLPPKVVAGVTHDDTKVRLGCVRALAWSRSPDALKGLVRALTDSQLDVRHEATVGLGRLGSKEAVEALRKALADRGDEVRLGAVRALADVRGPEATKALVEAARDDKYMIRVLAARELGWRAGEEGVLSALEKLCKDVDYGVREQAFAALSHHPRGADVAPLLLSGLADRDLGVRANACVALARVAGADAIAADPAVARKVVGLALDAGTAKLERATREFLDALRPPGAVEPLIAALGADTLDVRRRAHSLLQRITEANVGYAPDAPKGERDAGVERWRAWWAGKGGKLPPRGERGPRVVTSLSDEPTLAQAARDYKWKGLDIALLFDSTGSMAGLIRAAKERVDEMIGELQTLLPSLRVSVYTYRDHGDNYLFYGTPLTADPWKLSGFLQNATHGQGGDIPEAVYETVLNATTALAWRKDAHKVVIYAGDAPHHPEQEVDFLARIKKWFTKENQAQLHAIFTDTNRRSLDVKFRRERADLATFRSPFLEKYRLTATAGRGQAVLLDDESALIKELLVIAFGEPWRPDIELILDFER